MSNQARLIIKGRRTELVEEASKLLAEFETSAHALNLELAIATLPEVNANIVALNAEKIVALKRQYETTINEIKELTEKLGDIMPTII